MKNKIRALLVQSRQKLPFVPKGYLMEQRVSRWLTEVHRY